MSAPRKQLRDLAIFEISLVDKPAQEPAVIACVKRAVAKSEPAPPDVTTTEDKSMDPTQLAARLADLEAENAALKAKLADLEKTEAPAAEDEAEMAAMADLPADEFKHAVALAKAERRAFIATAAPDRAAIVAPIYKGADGTVYFKGDEKMVALAKRADDADAKAAHVALAKRAEVELAHLPGTADEKVAMLAAVEALPVAAKAVIAKALIAVDKRNAPLFKAEGTAEGPDVEKASDADPVADLETLAKSHAEKHGVSLAKAMTDVVATPAGADLYKAADAKRRARK